MITSTANARVKRLVSLMKKRRSRDQEEILLAEIHPQEDEELRMSWGVFRDRRPEMYSAITK